MRLSAPSADQVIAGASVLSAAFVGYQVLLSREAISDFHAAGRQSRQVDVCMEYLVAAGDVRSSAAVWFARERREYPFNDGDDVATSYYTQNVVAAQLRLSDITPKLSLIASEAVRSELDSLSSAATITLLSINKGEGVAKENEDSWFAQFDRAYESIRSRCDEIAAGDKRNLI